MSERNLVAFVRKDTYTLYVKHNSSEKLYTYVTAIQGLKEGDKVIAENITGLSIGTVAKVDSDLQIAPGFDNEIAWIVSKIDTDGIEALKAENRQIADAMAISYKNNLRNSYRDRVLANMSEEALALMPPSVR